MNRDRPDWRVLPALAVLLLAGCADELSEPAPGAAPAASQQATDAPETSEPGPGSPPPDSQRVTDPPEVVPSEEETSDPASSSPPPTIEVAAVEVGAEAPDFEATRLDGETVSFSDFLGEQTIVLAFSRGHW
jgi:hypothetical protein